MLAPSWKQHLSLKQFKPVHERPVTFIICQWQHDKTTPNIKYCLYRISILLIFFVSWVFTYAKESEGGQSRWPIYLTNWGYTLCTLQALLVCIMLIVSVIAEKVNSKSHWRDKIIKLYSTYWVINVISTPVAFTISIIYWTLIFGSEGTTMSALNFMVHGMNSVLMLIDLWIISHPVQILHFLFPLLLALTYTIFTIIYYLAGGTTKTGSRYIYPILKWDQPGKTTGVCAGVMVLMIILHLFIFFIYRIRIKIYEILYLPSIDPPMPEKEQSNGYVNKAMANDFV